MLLDNKFTKIMEHLKAPNPNHHAGDKQILYLTFNMEHTVDVKRKLSNWLSQAKGYDYSCAVLSMAKVINDFFTNHPNRSRWSVPDISSSFEDIVDFYKADLGSMITENRVIEKAILEEQEKIKSLSKPVLIITDLEAIHPFTRFGPIEQKIYSEIEIPIIILYPGALSGSSLEFFGFYPPDGNYRSTHF